jgi:tetratricopeptide (TPR) repeat protein
MERGREVLPSREEFPVSSADARNELERILSDPEFHCAERNKKFLRFIAEEFFAGRANALKAYAIAVDVFGRPESFDASTDPIVRIEATRLRSALIRYYETNAGGHGLEIRLPKGHYVPEFVRVARKPKIVRPEPPSGERTPWSQFVGMLHDAPQRLITGIALAACALVSAFATLSIMTFQSSSVSITDRPTVSVDIMLNGSVEDARALTLRDSLMIALSRFNTLRLSVGAYTASTGRSRPDARVHSRYQILLKYSADSQSRSMWWQVTDQGSGEAIRAGEEKVAADSLSQENVDDQLVSKLAVRIASIRGVINTIETARDLENPSLGNGCVLRAGLALTTGNPELRTNARSCLERTLKLRPYDPDAHAMLAAILLASDPKRTSAELASLASDHADQAVALAPQSDRSYMAQMMTAFRVGRLETARQAGRRAIALNPNNPAIAAKYSSILFAMGYWEDAVSLARKALLIDDIPQPDAERTLAFDAYRRGAYDEAIVRLKQMPESRCELSQLLLTASLAQAGDSQEASSMLATIKGAHPDFDQAFQVGMESHRLTPVLVKALGEGLKRAGSKVQ